MPHKSNTVWEWQVENDMLKVTGQEVHFKSNKLTVTHQEWHFKSDKSKDTS